MKKLFCLALAAVMAFAMVACASGTPSSNSTAAPASGGEASAPQETGSDVNWPTGNVMIYVPGQAGANMDIKARLVASI